MRPGCKIKLTATTILLGRTLARLKSWAQDKCKSQVAKLHRQTALGTVRHPLRFRLKFHMPASTLGRGHDSFAASQIGSIVQQSSTRHGVADR
eukprot:2840532-Rhodomonas_salina.1